MTTPRNPADVRMRGFAQRATVDTALAWVDAHASTLPAETVELNDAHGRILATFVTSPIDVPGFDRSAMDGYAVRGGETTGAGDYQPLVFAVVGESLPGRPFAGTVGPGEAVRIMTGAPLPAGADAVVPAEFAREIDGTRSVPATTGGSVEITEAAPPAKNVGRIGEDIRAGTVVLNAGRRLRPQDVAVVASLGIDRLHVVRRPRVRIIVTGNELVAPGTTKGPYQIYEANSYALRGLIRRDGAVLESEQHIADERHVISAALTAPGADVILVSGGSSVGSEDHAPTLLAEHGELAIHGIAMRPSSPAGMGRIGSTLVFLLPGNPVSCLCAYDFFPGRAIRVMGGRSPDWPYRRHTGRLLRKIVSAIGRVDYCRVKITPEGIEPLSLSGASILSSTTRADGFAILPAECEGLAPGTELEVFCYDPPC
jgi:molybdopterin molybdotransferase